ncbi:MAG: cupin domain-containing protein [Gemmatimonadota bacterium]
MTAPDSRLRPPPAERFAGPEHHIDFDTVLRRLRSEASPVRGGHRQETVYHRGAVRLMLFAFDAGGRLESHQAPGLVTIQSLHGTLQVTTATARYDVEPLQALVLDPGVPHDVEARTEADMLLTVHLEPPPAP